MTVLTPPATEFEGLPDNPMARNVALIYKHIEADIKNDTRTAPTFGDALALHEILNLIEESAKNDG